MGTISFLAYIKTHVIYDIFITMGVLTLVGRAFVRTDVFKNHPNLQTAVGVTFVASLISGLALGVFLLPQTTFEALHRPEASTAAKDVHDAISVVMAAKAKAAASHSHAPIYAYFPYAYLRYTKPATLDGTDGATLSIRQRRLSSGGTVETITLTAPKSRVAAKMLGNMLDQQLNTTALSRGSGTIVIHKNGAITYS